MLQADGCFYDDKKFWPVFGKAEELGVPIYLHPAPPTDQMLALLYSSDQYSYQTAFSLATAGWGWHELTGLHILRLMLAGLFDQFPRLQLIIGHAGEGLPFMFARISQRLGAAVQSEGRERDFETIMHQNVHITTAGFFSIPVMRLLLDVMPINRVMFSIDYPFSKNTDGLEFLEALRGSGLLTQDEFDEFTYKNACRLLHLTL